MTEAGQVDTALNPLRLDNYLALCFAGHMNSMRTYIDTARVCVCLCLCTLQVPFVVRLCCLLSLWPCYAAASIYSHLLLLLLLKHFCVLFIKDALPLSLCLPLSIVLLLSLSLFFVVFLLQLQIVGLTQCRHAAALWLRPRQRPMCHARRHVDAPPLWRDNSRCSSSAWITTTDTRHADRWQLWWVAAAGGGQFWAASGNFAAYQRFFFALFSADTHMRIHICIFIFTVFSQSI